MSSDNIDIFHKSEEQIVGEKVVLKGRSKRASSTSKKVKLTKKDMVTLNFEDQIPDDGLFGEVVLVNLEQSSTPTRTKVRYSVPPDVNRRFLFTLNILENLAPYAKYFGCTKSEYERNVVKPLQRFALGRVKPKKQKVKMEHSDTVKLSSFQIPRKAKDEYDKLYHKLKEEDNDMSPICYDNGFVSLLDSAKTIRMYFSVHDLKDAGTKHIVLDEFLKELFKDRIEELYTANKGEFVTQRQVQTLASWLVNKVK